MRSPLGSLPLAGVLTGLLVVPLFALAGCGQDDAPAASDPAPTSSTPSSTASSAGAPPTRSAPLTPGGVPYELLEIVSGTAGRGAVSAQAVPVASEADADAFVAGFSDAFAADVRAALDAHPVPDGRRRYAAVVGLGCDVPDGVDVTRAGDGYAVTGLKVADPLLECFAPVTSVALVAIAD